MTRTHRSHLALIALGALVASCAVLPDDDPGATSTSTHELSQLGVERVIPLRFVVLSNGTCPTTGLGVPPSDERIHGMVREANVVFHPAGVQFHVAAVQRITTATFAKLNQTTTYRWEDVWTQLAPIDPAVTATSFRGVTTNNDDFVQRVGSILPRSQVPVFIPCAAGGSDGPGAYAPMPDVPEPWNHYVMVSAPFVGSPSAAVRGTGALRQLTLAHELGHFLGLPHPRESSDPRYFDLLYGLRADGSFVPFRSAAEVTAHVGAVYNKDGYRPGSTTQPACGTGTATADTDVCNVTCYFSFAGGASYSTRNNPDVVTGIAAAYLAGENYGVNIMSYLNVPEGRPWACRAFLSGTQVARVREVLRGTTGDRHLLGRAESTARPGLFAGSQPLDFDGDGRRDLAVFRPSRTAGGSACIVRQSSNGATVTLAVSNSDADAGDVPVPADYDGDGKTDCAFFKPRPAGTSLWYWKRSRDGVVAWTTFGSTGDVPLPGVRMANAATGYGRVAVYTPGSGFFYWQSAAGVTRSAGLGAYHGDQPLPMDWDGDGFTDLAVWRPGAAVNSSTFVLSRSLDNYASWRSWGWGDRQDIVVPGMNRNGGRLDLAVYRPSTGVWWYLQDPGTLAPTTFSEGWGGTAGDVPLGGFDFDGDGRSDPVIYRPGNTTTGGSQFWVLKTTGGSLGRNLGGYTDVPFLSADVETDGRPELVVFRPSTATYYRALSSTNWLNYQTFTLGTYTDVRL